MLRTEPDTRQSNGRVRDEGEAAGDPLSIKQAEAESINWPEVVEKAKGRGEKDCPICIGALGRRGKMGEGAERQLMQGICLLQSKFISIELIIRCFYAQEWHGLAAHTASTWIALWRLRPLSLPMEGRLAVPCAGVCTRGVALRIDPWFATGAYISE